MSEYYSGAYFVKREGKKRGKRAAGVLILALFVLTAAICLLVLFLPKLTAVSSSVGFSGKTFYFMAVGRYSDRNAALLSSQDTVNRGGAGYIYNNGEYNIVAAVYDKESDAKALSTVNENSFYFEVVLPKLSESGGGVSALDYFVSEWFSSVQTAADELQRGTVSEAQAERVVADACFELAVFAENATAPVLRAALDAASEYRCPDSVSVLSYIRYVHVRAVALLSDALRA